MSFYLTDKGIEANPNKCESVIWMVAPSTKNEVARMNGKLTALNMFNSKLTQPPLSAYKIWNKKEHFYKNCSRTSLQKWQRVYQSQPTPGWCSRGSSNSRINRPDLILENEARLVNKVSLHFEFATKNNQVKYMKLALLVPHWTPILG